jgi:hypothetical protein
MPTFGSASSGGVPIQYTFSYDGTTKDWGSSRLFSLGDYSIKANAVDNNYQVSGLSCQLIDTDGVVWSTLGGGTNCLRKRVSLVAHVGGTSTVTSAFDGVKQSSLVGTQGAYTATLFTGRISEVSRSNRIVKLTGEGAIRQLSEMKWQFPVSKIGFGFDVYGSFYFSDVITSDQLGKFNVSEDTSEFDCVGYDVGTVFAPTLDVVYPPDISRTFGTDWCSADFLVPGTQFYFDYTRIKFAGSYLGTYSGTVTTDEFAWALGFTNRNTAEQNVVRNSSGTFYPVDKYRLTHRGSTSIGSQFFFESGVTLEGHPVDLFNWLMAGRVVEPFFSGTDINAAPGTFSRQVIPNYYFRHTVYPDSETPFELIKDLFQSTQALFSLNGNNQFEFRAYGPIDLSQTPGTILAGDVLDSSVESSSNDFTNRVIFKYAYSSEEDAHLKTIELRGSSWSRDTDTLKTVESKWVNSLGEGQSITSKILSRFQNARPKIEFTTPFKMLEYGVGTVLTLNDPDSFGTGKLAVLTGVEYDFENRQVTFTSEDGDALYRQRGYARFDSIGGTVTGTSKSGFSASGTVHNINESKYGPVFRWF